MDAEKNPAPDKRMEDASPESEKKKENGFVRRVHTFLENNREGKWPLFLAFLLPFLIFCLALAVRRVYPAGDRQIINYDGWHQYYPFLLRLWDHFREGKSLLYDWSMGMGTNFLSMLSYYGASPLNLLLCLAAAREFRVGFTLLLAIKIGLAGFFTALFLKKVFRPSWTLPFFGLGYALCGYLMGYYWNTMWIDSIVLYPLLCLCTVNMLRKGKGTGYVLVLGLTLFSNYYIGYMCCLFTVLVFLALALIDRVSFRNFWRRAARFTLYSLLGGALAAVMLLPAFFGLLNTTSVEGGFPAQWGYYVSVRDLFAPLSDFQTPAVMDGLPNLYAGGLIALFSFAFLWAKKVRFREKLAALIILIFLLVSMNISVFNYVWHGFHFTNMIPYRFAFLFAFVLVVMAYRYYATAFDGFDYLDAIGMFLFVGVLVFSAIGVSETVNLFACVFLLLLAILLSVFRSAGILPKKAFTVCVCLILTVELGVGAYLGSRAVGTTSYSGYFEEETGEAIKTYVAAMKDLEKDSEDFYRCEMTEWRSLNDSCFYNYPGISQFASSANVRVARILEGLGMSSDPGSNRFAYVHTTPLTNTLLGIKYLISRDGYLSDRDTTILSEATNKTTASLYRYEGYVGLGFMTRPETASYRFDLSQMPHERQNELFRLMTGLEGDLLTRVEGEISKTSGLSAADEGEGRYLCTVGAPGDTDPYLKVEYVVPDSGMVYVYAGAPDADYVQVNNAWHSIQDYPNFFSAGYFREGEKVTLRVTLRDLSEQDTENVTFHFCTLDEDLWQKGLEFFRRGKMTVTQNLDTRLTATVTSEEDGFLYTSIPLERKGWTVEVDGEKAEITPFADGFVGVALSAGEHTLTFTYVPQGFSSGALLTLLAVLLTLGLWMMEKKGFRLLPDRAAVADPPEKESEEKEEKNDDA